MLSTLITIISLSVLVAANPITKRGGGAPIDQCNTGSLQCCQSTSTTGAPEVAALFDALGVDLQLPMNYPVGLTCSVFGIGGNACAADPVCCAGNDFGGLLSLGCMPLDVEF